MGNQRNRRGHFTTDENSLCIILYHDHDADRSCDETVPDIGDCGRSAIVPEVISSQERGPEVEEGEGVLICVSLAPAELYPHYTICGYLGKGGKQI